MHQFKASRRPYVAILASTGVFLAALLVAVAVAEEGQEAPAPVAKPIFNGEDLTGWKCEPPELKDHWQVKDGVLVGENPDKKGSNLWTTREFTDFELTLSYKALSEDYDTGVFVRAGSHQVQIGISRSLQKDMTACIYAPKDGDGSYPAQSDKVAEVHRVGEWNELRIVVQGSRIQTFLNGVPFVDYTAKTLVPKGPIGVQLHGGVHMKALFRDIRLKDLSI